MFVGPFDVMVVESKEIILDLYDYIEIATQ